MIEQSTILERFNLLKSSSKTKKQIITNRIFPHEILDLFISSDYQKDFFTFMIHNIPSINSSFVPEKHEYANLIFESYDENIDDNTTYSIIITLKNEDFLRIFTFMILDVIQQIENKEFNYDLLFQIINDWSQYFKKRTGFSIEKSLGLISELLFLNNLLQLEYNVEFTLNSWTGPRNSSTDFTFSERMGIEIKASSKQKIKISSEYQLSLLEKDTLYLCVYPTVAPAEGNAISINEIINTTQNNIKLDSHKSILEKKILSYGFIKELHEENEGNRIFYFSSPTMYIVNEQFPKISKENIHESITRVNYYINDYQLDQYKVEKINILKKHIVK